MPSKFWKANSSQTSFDPVDPAPQPPRADSQLGYRPDDQSFYGGARYKTYDQPGEPFRFVDSPYPQHRPGGPPINLTPAESSSQQLSIGGQPYTHTIPSPRPDSSGQSDHSVKKSFRDRLGLSSTKPEEPESAGDTSHRFVFGRRKSIRRKEAPTLPGSHNQIIASEYSEPPSPQPSGQWQTGSQQQLDYFHQGQYEGAEHQEYHQQTVIAGGHLGVEQQTSGPVSPLGQYVQSNTQQAHYQAYHRSPLQDRPAGSYLQSASAPRTSLEQPRPGQISRPASRQSYESGNSNSGRPAAGRYPLHDEAPIQGPPSREGSFPLSQKGTQPPQPSSAHNIQPQHIQIPPYPHLQQQQQGQLPPPPPPHQQLHQQHQTQEYLQTSSAPQPQRQMDPNRYGQAPPQGGREGGPYTMGRQVSNEHEPPDPPGYSGYQGQGPPPNQGRTGAVAQQGDVGRATPPPSRTASDMTESDVNTLIKDYRDLRDKYSKVKKHYWEKDEQIKVLQNTIANQRMAQSRTQWDDGEYVNRLTRLDGLVGQLAYSIRKSWKAIPAWLQPFVNKDAITTGAREMTAVGKAYISRWLVDEVFDKYFHPALDPEVSEQLKTIQKNIRTYAPQHVSKEEEDSLTGKIIEWRLATADGLQPQLNSSDAYSHRRTLTELLNAKLIGDVLDQTVDLTKQILEADVRMIIDLAIALLGNLPLESRDVHIEYYLPGMPVLTEFMKIEAGIPALAESVEGEKPGQSGEGGAEGANKPSDTREEATGPSRSPSTKKGLFGFGSSISSTTNKSKGSSAAAPPSAGNNGQTGASTTTQPKEEPSPRVRMCVFLGMQIRGKNVLWKAPVYSI